MKKALCILIMFLSAIVSWGQTTQRVCLVEITEPTQEKTQKVVTVEMYQSLLLDMTAKNRVLSKAVDLAIKDWNEKHADAGPFPRQIASPGQVKSLGLFSDKAKAQQELKDTQAHDELQQKKKVSSAEKQLEQLRKQLANVSGIKNRTTAQQNQITSMELSIKVREEDVVRQKKKEEDRDANQAIARKLINVKLKQLQAEQDGEKPVPDKQTK